MHRLFPGIAGFASIKKKENKVHLESDSVHRCWLGSSLELEQHCL